METVLQVWKGAVVAYFKVQFQQLCGGIGRRNVKYSISMTGLGSNPERPKYENGILTTTPNCNESSGEGAQRTGDAALFVAPKTARSDSCFMLMFRHLAIISTRTT